MSVAFVKEERAETAAESFLPDRPVSPHPNLVTEAQLEALKRQLEEAREAYGAANAVEDVNERRQAPPPGLFLTDSSAPRASALALTTVRPVPLAFREPVISLRQNMLKED